MSGAANLHFHGTHGARSSGDNVLVQIEPDPAVTLQRPRRRSGQSSTRSTPARYTHGHMVGRPPRTQGWQNIQNARLTNYDNNHQFQGKKLKDWGTKSQENG
jgi:hypothetical protein